MVLICSIGAVNATDLDDNSTVEVSSDVDDSISVDDALINDNVEQSQDVASTNAATWDELKTACQSSGDKVITLLVNLIMQIVKLFLEIVLL